MIKNFLAKIFVRHTLLVVFFFLALIRRYFIRRKKPKLLWASSIINDSYYSKALSKNFTSRSITWGVYSINKKSDFDIHLPKNFVKRLILCINLFFSYDIIFFSFNGGYLSELHLDGYECWLYSLARIKTGALAYGSDVAVYDKINNTAYANTLNIHYPLSHKKRFKNEKNIRQWLKFADVILPMMFLAHGFYRWDVLTPNGLCIDIEKFSKGNRTRNLDRFIVAHSPNHRFIKGTEYLIDAVENLKSKGLDIELRIIEKMKNEEVLKLLKFEANILVEKLVGPSYALSGIEGMSCGIPVISNINTSDWSSLMKVFYRYSFLGECPIVSANPDNIVEVLEYLYYNRNLCEKLGKAGREYVKKYHSYEAAQYMFGKIIDKIWYNKEVDLINMYHPLVKTSYNNLLPKVIHPLVRNKINKNQAQQL